MVILKGHPSIPNVDAWGRSQYYEYLTMQLLDPTLAHSVRQGKRLDIPSAACAAEQLVDVLSHMRGRSIIQCDIKPNNMLFGTENDSDRVYLVDFGFASYYRDPTTLVHRPMETNVKDDIESLAYVFLELVQGTLPLENRHDRVLIQQEKEAWTGAELAVGVPSVFGEFIDYARTLEYTEEPDYFRWRTAFRELDGCSGQPVVEQTDARHFDERVHGPRTRFSRDYEEGFQVRQQRRLDPYVYVAGLRRRVSPGAAYWG
ncbi:hypothetical protein DXG03_004649 [Asterophora parasitica]|uniref:Protein kinase domain-containing protein n=1 Tax=Asterophora parasitica TaxID=117018 RepID=A0A9P7G004_9AGAR|nr:hypothetical protein DXG03_004649 [Asterophora parasitica]